MISMVIDTDAGVDDAVAVWWALDRPDIDVVALTTVWGNVDLDRATVNACAVLHAHGSGAVPVAAGSARPLAGAPELRRADFLHGADGLGGVGVATAPFGAVDEHAVALLHRLVDERPHEITIVCLGPLTNIASAILRDRSWAGRVGSLVVMGGVIDGPGNAQPQAEANFAHDPSAAAVVVGAPWSSAPLLVGLDVTHRATLSSAQFDLADRGLNGAARFLAGPLATYRRFGGTFCEPGECSCHDLVAVMAATIPDLLSCELLPLAVITTPGPAWGATIADRRVPFFARTGEGAAQATPAGFSPWRVAIGADVERFRAEVRRFFGDSSPFRDEPGLQHECGCELKAEP